MNFEHIPAIDVRRGCVVRLQQGDYAQETRYADAPVAVAERYAAEGACWLHLVDLDAAKSGAYTLLPLLAELTTRTALMIQTGGGVRTREDVRRLLDAGVRRVVVGTLAIREPETVLGWLSDLGAERLTLALDTRADASGVYRLPSHGWTQDSGIALFDLLDRYSEAGLRHLLCTDIARDGMLGGLNLDLYRTLAARYPQLAVQASGGVATLEDVRGARAAGAGGVVLGKALLEGRFTLSEALSC